MNGLRAFVAVGGLVLFAVGIIMTFATMTASGWTVLAVVGVALLAIDQAMEERGNREPY